MGTLKNLVIAVTGTFEHDITRLKKWIEANSGRYSPNVRRGITHLITGKDAWRQASDAVQAANKLGIFIVSFEWLEDSLHKRRKLAEKQYTWEYITQQNRRKREIKKLGPAMSNKQFNDGCEEVQKNTGSGTSKSCRPRVVVRKPRKSTSVLIGNMHVPFVSAAEDLKRRREEREVAKAKRAAAKQIEDANSKLAASNIPSMAQSSSSALNSVSSPAFASLQASSTTTFQPAHPVPGVQAKKPTLKDLYHYYLDTTGFEYKIVLMRCNLRANEVTRYRLSILESHTKPHVYCTFIEYFPPGVGNTTSGGDGCIQALLDFDKTFYEGSAPKMNTGAFVDEDKEDKTNVSRPLSQQNLHTHPEAERLRALLLPPTASPTPPASENPYKSLIAPMSSPFEVSWRAFRHAFRDLTLLSWEERFDISKTLYKARATHFAIEPFVYVRPKPGLPLGLRTQQNGLFQNQTLAPLLNDGSIRIQSTPESDLPNERHNDDAYVYNTFNLPALNAPLGPGIIGQAVQRDTKAAREAAEHAQKIADEAEEARLSRLGLARKVEGKKKPNYSRPLFNGVNGRPTMDAWGKPKRAEGGVGGVGGSGLLGGGVVQRQRDRRAWPYETGRL